MARPRIHVNRHGKSFRMSTGASVNTARQQLHVIRSDGKRQGFKTGHVARAALAMVGLPRFPPLPSPSFRGTAGLSATRRDPAWPSRAAGCRLHAVVRAVPTETSGRPSPPRRASRVASCPLLTGFARRGAVEPLGVAAGALGHQRWNRASPLQTARNHSGLDGTS